MNPLFKEIKGLVDEKINTNMYEKKGDPWSLSFHFMPPGGWLNDPNGVCQYKGIYNLYYQYSPNDVNGGLKYWGHATSDDLVSFKNQGIAIYPDQPYDLHGVYSGSAFIKGDDIHFFYTGNVKHLGNYDYINSGREQNTIHAISKDGGKTIKKIGKIISAYEYPEGFSNHVRDPKVTQIGNVYFLILGARDITNKGKILTYKSRDLYEWEYAGLFLESDIDLGYMWECPDYFRIDNTDVLLICPQGLEKQEFEFQNIYQSGYILGKVDLETFKFKDMQEFMELDKGFDFYAPQTFEDEKGRRILWAWMGLPSDDETISNPTIEFGWQHAMTLPRELSVKGNKLYQTPLPEFEKIRDCKIEKTINVKGKCEFDDLNGAVFEMIIDFENIENEFIFFLREDTSISYSVEEGVLFLKHGKSGYGRNERKVRLNRLSTLQIFSDHSSLEIFINGGEEVMTSRVYPIGNNMKMGFDGRFEANIRKWSIKTER